MSEPVGPVVPIEVADPATTAGPLDQSCCVDVDALGVTITLSLGGSRSAELHEAVSRAWSMSSARATGQPGARLSASLVEDGEDSITEDSVTSTDLGLLLTLLTQKVTRTALAKRAGELLMFHAGGVCRQDTGATLVYSAPGGTGKTTLTRMLGSAVDLAPHLASGSGPLAAGLGYVSDESIGITTDGFIEPYLKPLSVRGPIPGETKDEMHPSTFGLAAPAVRPWVARVLVIRRDPKMAVPVLRPLSTLEAITLLAPETSWMTSMDRPLHRMADLVESTGGAMSLTYSEAADVIPLLGDLLPDQPQRPGQSSGQTSGEGL